MNGQLLPREREWLHNTIRQLQPLRVMEIGTWKGGGSTMQIRAALSKNTRGVLYSCEPDIECFNEASENHKDAPNVKIFNQTGEWLIKHLVSCGEIPDVLFFDGCEDAQMTMDYFEMIEPYLKPDAHFISHDWDTPPSIKNQILRPHLEKSESWHLEELLQGEGTVGMCLYRLKA